MGARLPEREGQQRREQRLVGLTHIDRLTAQHVGHAGHVRVMPADGTIAAQGTEVHLQHQARLGAVQHEHQAPRRRSAFHGAAAHARLCIGPCHLGRAAEPGLERKGQRLGTVGVGLGTGGPHRLVCHADTGSHGVGQRWGIEPRHRCAAIGHDLFYRQPESPRLRQTGFVRHQCRTDVLAVEPDRAGAQTTQVQARHRVGEEADRLLVDGGAIAAQAGVQRRSLGVLRQQRFGRLQPDRTHQRGVIEVITEVEIGRQGKDGHQADSSRGQPGIVGHRALLEAAVRSSFS